MGLSLFHPFLLLFLVSSLAGLSPISIFFPSFFSPCWAGSGSRLFFVFLLSPCRAGPGLGDLTGPVGIKRAGPHAVHGAGGHVLGIARRGPYITGLEGAELGPFILGLAGLARFGHL